MDEKFIKIIADALRIAPESLNETSTLGTIAEWDSLNHWIVISKLEDAYGIEFTMEEATEFKNLKHMYEMVYNKLR